MREYINVCDLAHAHVLAIEYLWKGGETLAVNLGAGRGVSVWHVIDPVRRVTGHEVIARDAATSDLPILVADPTKAPRGARLGARAI